MADTAVDLAELVATVVEPLIDHPEELEITPVTDDDGNVLIEIHVNPEDAGKVIGRQGRVIKSVRTLARAAASRKNVMVDVELID